MTKLATGVDLIEVARIGAAIERYGERFLRRIFTSRELTVTHGRVESLAARFAAKEAVAKTLGVGIGEVAWLDIEVLSGPNRQPELHLSGKAAKLAAEQGLTRWAISLSHSQLFAIAMVTAMGE
ncbi:MAG: holo-ACP synthase [Anaerolineales bacterium]|nr:holo-ACP synthase [Anaerolineales bacterium]